MTAKQITYLLLICVPLAMTQLGCSTKTTPETTISASIAVTDPTHWSHRTRIAGHGLRKDRIPAIIQKVQETHVFGIETTYKPAVVINGGPGLATQVARVDGKPHIFIANYSGLVADENANQIPQADVEVTFKDADKDDNILYLPYLGEKTVLESSYNQSGLSSKLPAITRGAVLWLETKT
ncbi:hypothetical protein HQ531_07795 [bacterium]|nr:hypothetical protein [bacterium]